VIESDKKFAILSDILGIEDFKGDMDFKVAGSKYGITALQLDVKTLKLTTDILKKALEQALEGRLYILDFMLNNAIDKPRESVSKYAPKIKWVQIPIERVGELIGPGGRTIKGLIAETGTDIDVDEKGRVYISSTDAEVAAKVANRISMMMKDPQKGEIYEGEVKRIQPFGVFVEILPGKEGLVHISDMSTDFVRNPEDLVGVGQKVTVRVKEIDELGRVNLSMVLDPAYDDTKGPRKNRDEAAGEAKEVTAHGRSDTSFARDRGRFSRERKQSFGFGYRGRDKRGGRGGPHFPTSRLMDDPNNNFGK
jgi:polyribonucleotide nucleotidyltransferase